MSDYLQKYFRQTFGLEQMAVEWAYSLHDAAARFISNSQIALFWSVLNDEVWYRVDHGNGITNGNGNSMGIPWQWDKN